MGVVLLQVNYGPLLKEDSLFAPTKLKSPNLDNSSENINK